MHFHFYFFLLFFGLNKHLLNVYNTMVKFVFCIFRIFRAPQPLVDTLWSFFYIFMRFEKMYYILYVFRET